MHLFLEYYYKAVTEFKMHNILRSSPSTYIIYCIELRKCLLDVKYNLLVTSKKPHPTDI